MAPLFLSVVEPVLCNMDNKEAELIADNEDALVSSKEKSATPPDEGSSRDHSSSPEAPEVCVCVCVREWVSSSNNTVGSIVDREDHCCAYQ